MSRTRRIASVGVLVVLLGALSGCGGGSGDVVARVGASTVAKATLEHWASVMGGSGAARSGPGGEALRARALGFLIGAQRLLGEAAEVGARASDEEARAQLEQVKYDAQEGIPYEGFPRGGELSALFARARTRADKLWLMKLAILTAKVQVRQVRAAERQITGAQVAGYYEAHKPSFVAPERRDLVWIVVYSKRILRNAVREIRAGKSFLAVAKRVSLDPPTITGLELANSEEKDFARHIFAAKPHVLEGPFRQSQNYYVLEVTKVTPARQRALAEAGASIRHQLAVRWVNGGLREQREASWKARTRCGPGYVAAGCGGAGGGV